MAATETTTIIPAGDLGDRPRSHERRLPGHRHDRGLQHRQRLLYRRRGPLRWRETPVIAGTIRVAGLRTDNAQRDAAPSLPDFLEAEKYPEIHFASKSF